MLSLKDVQETLFKFIRGKATTSDLNNAGIFILIDPNAQRTTIEIKSELQTLITPIMSDFAQGLMSITTNHDLKEWANFILASDLISLDGVEKHPKSDELLNALWDISFDGFIHESRKSSLLDL